MDIGNGKEKMQCLSEKLDRDIKPVDTTDDVFSEISTTLEDILNSFSEMTKTRLIREEDLIKQATSSLLDKAEFSELSSRVLLFIPLFQERYSLHFAF